MQAFEFYTPKTISDPDAFRAELARIRTLGYAVNIEGRIIGVSGIAAPILDSENYAVAAVSVSGPSARLTEDRFAVLAESVRDTAQRISAARGFGAWRMPTDLGFE